MSTKKSVSKLLFATVVLLFTVGFSFTFGYQVRGKIASIQDSKKLPAVSPTATPLSQQDRAKQLDEMNQQQIKRQFVNDELPLLPDLQQALQNQDIGMVSLHTLNNGKVSYIVETARTESVQGHESDDMPTRNYYFVLAPTWFALEENLSIECSLGSVQKFVKRENYVEKNVLNDISRLLYQVNCDEGSRVGLISLNTGEKIKIHGSSLPGWLKGNMLQNGSFIGELSHLSGHGSNLVFEVILSSSPIGSYRLQNRVVISGRSGEVVDWLDYDQYSPVVTPAFGVPAF